MTDLAKKYFTIAVMLIFCLQISTIMNAQTEAEKEVNMLMNNWHKAAATGDSKVFFGSMADNGIYIGTDATERWTKDEMEVWSKKYFDRGSAWDFKTIERQVHISTNGQYAWFNETLNTWMGVCRGSGILSKEKSGWKIEQYHLSVTIDNNLIESFVKLVGAPGRTPIPEKKVKE